MIVWLAWVYDMISNLAPFRETAAIRNGAGILHLEALLHVDPERALDTWLAGHPLLGVVTGDYYDNAHFVVTFAVIGWLWWHHPRQYRPMRTALILANLIGFAVFWLYPVAPPRLLPGARFADIVALTHAIGGWHSGTLGHEANQFASMPSLHLGWAVWAAWAAWRVWRGRRFAVLVWAYPAATAVAVMATGNHYLLDVVAGIVTTAMSVVAADAIDRRLRRRRSDRAGRRPPRSAAIGDATAPAGVGSSSAVTGAVATPTPTAGRVAQATNAQAEPTRPTIPARKVESLREEKGRDGERGKWASALREPTPGPEELRHMPNRLLSALTVTGLLAAAGAPTR